MNAASKDAISTLSGGWFLKKMVSTLPKDTIQFTVHLGVKSSW